MPDIPPIGSFVMPPISTDDFPSPAGTTALMSELRHHPHDGFARIVLEFRSGDDLSYSIDYVPEAVPPSGDPIEIDGEVILQVTMTPASGVDLSGTEAVKIYTGPTRLTPADAEVVSELVLVEDFEAVLVWAIGLPEERPVAAALLMDPMRLVIDIPIR